MFAGRSHRLDHGHAEKASPVTVFLRERDADEVIPERPSFHIAIERRHGAVQQSEIGVDQVGEAEVLPD